MLIYEINVYLSLILMTTAGKCLAQYPLNILGGPVHIVGSTIQCTFAGPVAPDSRSISIVWRFNNTDVCNIFIQRMTITAASCSSSDSYYSLNSVMSAALPSSGFLNATLIYSNIQRESSDIIVTVTDTISVGVYNQTVFSVKDREIISTGQHSSKEFLWSVGIDNLSFNISSMGISSSSYNDYIHDWQHVFANGTTLVSFQTLITSSSLNGVACYNGTSFINPQSVSAYGIDYRIDCTLVDSTLESQFTIFSPLSSSYNGSIVKVEVKPPGVGVYTKGLRLKFCKELLGNDRLVITGGSNAQYKAVANYTCSNSALVVNNQYDKNVNACSRSCEYNAQWSSKQELDCWYAPIVDINITQADCASNEPLVSENYAVINCFASPQGNPKSSFTLYYKNSETIGSAIFLDSNYNGASISCQLRNSYVNQVDETAGYSPKIILNVLYQPEPQNGVTTERENARIGDNYTIVIQFNANPRVELSDTAMYFNGNKLDFSKANITYQDNLHTYRYLLTEVSNESFGAYILSTRSPSPKLAGRITNFTVILNSTESISTTPIPESTSSSIETVGLSTATVAAISTSVGIVLTIIATSAVWWWMLKRMGKGEGSMNHEKKELAYEPTYVDGQPLESAYEDVNRETIEDNMRVAPQVQTNVNSAYEVIR